MPTGMVCVPTGPVTMLTAGGTLMVMLLPPPREASVVQPLASVIELTRRGRELVGVSVRVAVVVATPFWWKPSDQTRLKGGVPVRCRVMVTGCPAQVVIGVAG